jgi:hypothetical protein
MILVGKRAERPENAKGVSVDRIGATERIAHRSDA